MQKRRYTKGFYFSSHQKKSSTQTKNNLLLAETKSVFKKNNPDSSSQTTNKSVTKTVAEAVAKKNAEPLFQKNSFSKNELILSTQESKDLKESSLVPEGKGKTEMESKANKAECVVGRHAFFTILLIYFLVGAIIVEIFYIYLTVSGAYPAGIFIVGNALIIIALIITLVRRSP